ncbi:hypothetical protein C5F47_04720 [Nitrosopumilus cobalaminigenes]|uniref:Uncharacterized protein n=1 Tax=Nitrosopumilus cobalaminigenes TaxID=1470066 RepID=A0A7D5R2F2_9ARCH|nr:hypothetical protein [Nitrosopumilus cobalaminigenes]QLH02899.1 hypothetical protein C5F47_04720 [Nitrosopumilus cobalaminigenes]
MVKSLGDYNKEKSSSSDLKNIVWSKKDLQNLDKPKTKNKKKISPTNNLPTKNKKTKESIEKVFKIESNTNEEKAKSTIDGKKFRESSATNCKIERGYKRPAR